MSPQQWARILAAGERATHANPLASDGTALAMALGAMTRECGQIAQEEDQHHD